MSSELDQYDFRLPEALIAQYPLARRSDARLMLVDRRSGDISHHTFRDLPELLAPADTLVLNDSKVLPARLVGRREATGGRWSGLFLESDGRLWRVIGKTRGALKPGENIVLEDRSARDAMKLALVEAREEGQWIVRPSREGDVETLLEEVGRVPLPHYIRDGEMLPRDLQDYQTVYAAAPGSVAAPTAGLHFDARLLAELARHGVGLQRITLHVGLGTFRPIKAERLSEHVMHAERAEITAATVQRLNATRARGGRMVAVGTTAVRTLETAARSGTLAVYRGVTDLFIRPGHTFHAVDALITNFHLPRTTLLVLVCAFAGRELVLRAYEEAVAQEYRFFSYGDGMFIV